LLAETSQQPISQTTWLKVTPHCNHRNDWLCEAQSSFNLFFYFFNVSKFFNVSAEKYRLHIAI
jgi:hypothetical protein